MAFQDLQRTRATPLTFRLRAENERLKLLLAVQNSPEADRGAGSFAVGPKIPQLEFSVDVLLLLGEHGLWGKGEGGRRFLVQWVAARELIGVHWCSWRLFSRGEGRGGGDDSRGNDSVCRQLAVSLFLPLPFSSQPLCNAGSPLPVFLAIRGVCAEHGRGLGTEAAWKLLHATPAWGGAPGDGLPRVRRLLNLYHPYDPVGHRCGACPGLDCIRARGAAWHPRLCQSRAGQSSAAPEMGMRGNANVVGIPPPARVFSHCSPPLPPPQA